MKTHHLAEFQKAAADFVLEFKLLPDRATVVGLCGELGSETTSVEAAARALGVDVAVSSPTFLIFKSYKLSAKNYTLLVHVDVYRLTDSTELARLRFDELLADSANLIFVEWADRVADVLPKDYAKIFFELVDARTRKITL